MANETAPPLEFDSALSETKAHQLKRLASDGLMARHASFSVVDFDILTTTVREMQSAFPGHFGHAFAVKSNFHLPVLAKLATLGCRAEVAGAGELELAIQAGFEPAQIVFDAPVKTVAELDRALSLGLTINIDNFQELERIAVRRNAIKPDACLGFRINPQIGAGSVALSSTATMTSKFGVGLVDEGNREQLINAYSTHDWLNSIHVHVGSVGCPLDLMVEGVATVFEFAKEINLRSGRTQIRTIDIGGGLPVNFSSDETTPEFKDYASILEARVPGLFSGAFGVITEFGRSIVAKPAFTIARVEYTKVMGGRHIALTHAGAHNMMRIVFQPEDWARRVTALDPNGAVKKGPLVAQDVAGPCCFAGDIIAHQRLLPLLEPGDAIMVHDTGAYCFANHFNYNALPPDPVYVFETRAHDKPEITLVDPGQSTEKLTEAYA